MSAIVYKVSCLIARTTGQQTQRLLFNHLYVNM
jgi:hypothetical protein